MCYTRYRNIGCYNDLHFRQRPLSDRLQLEDERACPDVDQIASNETASNEWNQYIYDLVCRCAEKAKKEKYNYFGIQDCGKFLVTENVFR